MKADHTTEAQHVLDYMRISSYLRLSGLKIGQEAEVRNELLRHDLEVGSLWGM